MTTLDDAVPRPRWRREDFPEFDDPQMAIDGSPLKRYLLPAYVRARRPMWPATLAGLPMDEIAVREQFIASGPAAPGPSAAPFLIGMLAGAICAGTLAALIAQIAA